MKFCKKQIIKIGCKSLSKLKTIKSLGILNVIRVILYRVTIKLRIHRVCYIKSETPLGPYFLSPQFPPTALQSNELWNKTTNLFGHFSIPLGNKIPAWLSNPITGNSFDLPLLPWWKISDFDHPTGDIKLIWEQSRMDWVVTFAQRARNGDNETLQKLNEWLNNWVSTNPAYLGPNWKCGQEASIRLINLACGALILEHEKQTLKGLQQLIIMHLRRISPTINYAISQDNNHGTSEAVALFVGGSWLQSLGYKDGKKFEKMGRKWLENRVDRLFDKDGGFSQYSLNYHRMALDTLSFAEIWRQKLNRKPFSSKFQKKSIDATLWLYQLISPENGRGPNIGANDGARLLQLTNSSYEDYRPSVQLAMALFNNCDAYPMNKDLTNHLGWLGVNYRRKEYPKYQNCDFSNGGFVILRNKDAAVIFRYPMFRFRPSHADALHLDLWNKGYNLLNDAGSYSYNSIPDFSEYFSGSKGHNTVEFDGRDQMPKISRFLFGNWLSVENIKLIAFSKDFVSFSASYTDYKKAQHIRTIYLGQKKLVVIDNLKGFKQKAVLRWRLKRGDWSIKDMSDGVSVSNSGHTLYVKSDVDLSAARLSKGWYSTHYMKKHEIPVFEAEINSEGSFTTEYCWE
jgi:hypothetical protein